jgi:hypothetical protein
MAFGANGRSTKEAPMHLPDRRHFLTSAAGAFFAAHRCSAAWEPMPGKGEKGEPLIRRLELLRLISFEAREKKEVSVFPTDATVRGSRRAKHALPRFPYEIAVEA